MVGALVKWRSLCGGSMVKAWLPAVGGKRLGGGPCGGVRAWSVVLEPRSWAEWSRKYVRIRLLNWKLVT